MSITMQNRSSKYSRLSSQQSSNQNDRSKRSSAYLWYTVYLATIVLITAASIIFWAVASHQPILFSVDAGQWITANQKYTTIICTIAGTLLASLTIWLLNRILVVMGKQVITSNGAKLSVIEFWHRMFNKDFIFDGKRAYVSALTLTFWVAVLYLGTAYTSLITPVNVLVSRPIGGTEIDFASEQFWDWYNYQDEQGNLNRTIRGCGWTTFNNSKGSTTFPLCPYNNDPINFLQAGFTSAQRGLSLANKSAVNYLDKHYESSTGGTLPYGWAGFLAFSDVDFEHLHRDAPRNYNYSLVQQGLTAEVSCQSTADSPIKSTHIDYINNTIPGLSDGEMNYVNFTWTCPEGQTLASSGQPTGNKGTAQIVTPKTSWATLVVCQSEPATLHEYTIFIGAFGSYVTDQGAAGVSSSFPNMTCSLKPMLTNTTLSYSSDDGLFRTSHTMPISNSGSKVPNETYQAVDRAFSLAISNSENMVIDSIHGFAAIDPTISISTAMEFTLKGYIEYLATGLRMYYSSNEPPGRRDINGNITVWRIGYSGQPIVLAGLLPPLLLICGLAIAYTIIGFKTGLSHLPDFDPVNSVSILAASAAGGNAKKFPISDFGIVRARDHQTLEMCVRYDRLNGYIVAKTLVLTSEETELDRLDAEASTERSDV